MSSNIVVRDLPGFCSNNRVDVELLEAVIKGVRVGTSALSSDEEHIRQAMLANQCPDDRFDAVVIIFPASLIEERAAGWWRPSYSVSFQEYQAHLEALLKAARDLSGDHPFLLFTHCDVSHVPKGELTPLFEGYTGVGNTRIVTAYTRTAASPDGKSIPATDQELLMLLKEAVERAIAKAPLRGPPPARIHSSNPVKGFFDV